MRSRGGLACAALLLFRASISGGTSCESGPLPHHIEFPFIANLGQTDPCIAFYVPGDTGTMFVTRNGSLVHSLAGGRSEGVEELFVEGNASPAGEERGHTQVSYFLGSDRSKWRNRVPTFRTVSLGDVWRGVRVVLRADGKGVEKIFTVAPFASEALIRVRVEGAQSLSITDSGSLIGRADSSEFVLTSPSAYQEIEGTRQPVAVRYAVSGREYGFRLGTHDPALPVVIDPLLQSTYLGGGSVGPGPEGFDEASCLAVHPSSGEVYLAGTTYSFNFPGTAGGAQPMISGFYDAFVARLDPTLRELRQATFLGANAFDSARSLAIQPASGDVYVAGLTGSQEFPGTIGGAQQAFGGTFGFGTDGFIARFDPSLTTLIQATYLGGMGSDEINGIALRPSGDLYAAGETTSGDFPVTTGGAQATLSGFRSAFVARLSLDLASLRQATYLGGDHFSRARAIAVSEDVYVVGETGSRDFPGTTGGAQEAFGGGSDNGGDAFVARLAPDLVILRQATYLGGVQDDAGTALVLRFPAGEVYVGGYTNSLDFPGAAGGAQASYGGGILDAFLARFDARLTSLLQTTYFGGDGLDEARAVAIHPTSGDIYAGGKTASAALPGSLGGVQATFGGGSDVGGDAFAARLNSSLTSLAQSTYLGGTLNDEGNALAVHPVSGDVYLVGGTFSTNFPGTTGGAQPTFGGFYDAFAAHLTSGLTGGPQGPVEPIPAVSAWGLLFLAVLLATVAIHSFGRSSGPGGPA